MELFIELLKEVNIAQIFVLLGGFWIFYNRLDKKIEKLDDRLTGEIQKVNDRLTDEINKVTLSIDKLSQKVEDIDRRLCRIEGSLATHGYFTSSIQLYERKKQAEVTE